MEYHDLDIWLDNCTAEGYPLRACCPPHGEVRDVWCLDPDEGVLSQMRDRVTRGETDSALLKEFGTLLYSSLFSAKKGDLEALFERCCGDFLGKAEGIRVRLRIEPPKVAALPWEFLYSPRADDYVATSTATPLLRYVELLQEIRQLTVRLPLRMLVAVPEGSGLDSGTETANLLEALAGLEKEVTTHFLEKNVTCTAISDALLEGEYHVFHFIGHGEFQNDAPFLLLNDGRGGLEAVDHEQFAGLFRNHASMKLVLLNSCKGAEVSSVQPLTGMAAQLVKRGVPAVIAMQYAIGDDQAVLFSREFYRALFRGGDKGRVEMAISHARNCLLGRFPDDRVVGTPVLYSRATRGVLFDLVTGDRLKDIPRTQAEIHTGEAVLRAHEDNLKALEGQPADTAGVTEAIQRESAELRQLKLRLRLGKASLAAAFVVAPLLFALFWLGVFERLPPGLKLESYAVWLVEKFIAKHFSDRIALVPMTEDTANKIGRPLPGHGANWRDEHAKLVDRLARAGAKVVVFDISFAEAKEPAAFDQEFARAIGEARERGTTVVAGIDDVPAQASPPVFADEARGWGLLCLGQTQGSTDIAPMLVGRRGLEPVPSLALAAVAAYNGWTINGLDPETMRVLLKDRSSSVVHVGVSVLDRLPKQPKECTFLRAGDLVATKIIDFTPRELLRTAAQRFAYEGLLSAPDARIAEEVQGKIVVIGVEVPGDRFEVRRGLGTADTYGYEIHADAMSTLLRGIDIRPIGSGLQFLIIFGVSLFGDSSGRSIRIAREPDNSFSSSRPLHT